MPGTIIRRGKSYVVVMDHGRDEDGKRIRKWKSFATRREAETFQIQSATHPAFGAGQGPYGSGHLRLSGYLQQWLSDYAKSHVRGSTFERYEELVRVHLTPGLGHIQLSRLSPQAIERFYRELHGTISPTTAHHVASLLRGALKQAVMWGLIVKNPSDLVEKPKRVRSAPVLLSTEQAECFLEGARGTRYYLLYALLITTGLRLGEALALQWSDIDLKRGTLLVREGKTANARRALILPENLVSDLRAVRGVGLVFSRNGKPLNPWAIRKCHFYPLLKKLGLPKIRLHDMRHMHGSFLLEQGADLASVSARLGHASKAFTLSTYVHALASGQEKAAQVANQLLTRSGGVKTPNAVSSTADLVPPAGFEPALPA